MRLALQALNGALVGMNLGFLLHNLGAGQYELVALNLMGAGFGIWGIISISRREQLL